MAREQQDKKKRKNCTFCADKVTSIDYKDGQKLKRYLTEAGKILPRRITLTLLIPLIIQKLPNLKSLLHSVGQKLECSITIL